MEAAATLNDRVTAITGVDMHRLAGEIAAAQVEYEKQKAQVEYLEDMRKSVLASIMEEIRRSLEDDGQKVVEARLDSQARASESYKNFLVGQRDDKERLAELSAAYYLLRNTLDITQAQLSFVKSEMYLER